MERVLDALGVRLPCEIKCQESSSVVDLRARVEKCNNCAATESILEIGFDAGGLYTIGVPPGDVGIDLWLRSPPYPTEVQYTFRCVECRSRRGPGRMPEPVPGSGLLTEGCAALERKV